MSGWTIAWLLWIVVALVIEAKALTNKTKGDTLSEHVWKWADVRGKSRMARFRRYMTLVIMLWLTLHFVTGGWV